MVAMAMVAMTDGGAIDAGVHHFPLRVYYEDTDAGGIVYHASYLRFVERARTEMLRCLGLDHGSLRQSEGLTFAVRRVEVDFRAPAVLDDQLVVRTQLSHLRGASIDLVQEVWRTERVLVDARIRLVLLDRHGRAARLPAPLRAALGAVV